MGNGHFVDGSNHNSSSNHHNHHHHNHHNGNGHHQMQHNHYQNPNNSNNLNRNGNGNMMMLGGGPRATYSLPRAPTNSRHSSNNMMMTTSPGQPTQGYYTQDRRNVTRYNKGHHNGHNNGPSSMLQPPADFYFMPSQRKYSGEVVRVYVDYNNQKSK